MYMFILVEIAVVWLLALLTVCYKVTGENTETVRGDDGLCKPGPWRQLNILHIPYSRFRLQFRT